MISGLSLRSDVVPQDEKSVGTPELLHAATDSDSGHVDGEPTIPKSGFIES